jgi:hypothetical protein
VKKSALIVSLSLASTGCATFPPFPLIKQESRVTDYVSPEVSPVESRKITADMARFLSEQLPAARTTIDIGRDQGSFHEMLATELAWKGFGVVEGLDEGEDIVPLRYFVTTLGAGIVVRMKYLDQVAGRFYRRGASLMGGAYAVREAGK